MYLKACAILLKKAIVLVKNDTLESWTVRLDTGVDSISAKVVNTKGRSDKSEIEDSENTPEMTNYFIIAENVQERVLERLFINYALLLRL